MEVGSGMDNTDKGRIETEKMFALIGRAITRWSFVEERLGAIFMVCTSDVAAYPDGGLNFMDASVPQAVFYAVESFRGKLNLVDAAMSSHLHQPEQWAGDLKAEWARLREKTRKLSLRRNKLAHYTVLPGHDYEDITISPRLVPPFGSPGYYRETGLQPGKQTLKLLHLDHLEHAFCLLEDKLRDFAYRLARQEELFDIYAHRLVRRIQTHSRQDPTRAARLKLALSYLD